MMASIASDDEHSSTSSDDRHTSIADNDVGSVGGDTPSIPAVANTNVIEEASSDGYGLQHKDSFMYQNEFEYVDSTKLCMPGHLCLTRQRRHRPWSSW